MSIIMMTKKCVICGAEFVTESIRKETCKKKCRIKRKAQISHKKEREKGWVKMRSRLNDRHKAILKRAGVPGPYRVGDYLRASTKKIKKAIEAKFEPWMNWSNYGFDKKDALGNVIQKGWVVDHITPCQLYDVSRQDHLMVLWHLDNLRPVHHIENLVKLDNIHMDAIPASILEKVQALGIQLTDGKERRRLQKQS